MASTARSTEYPETEARSPRRRTADMTGTKRPTNISLDAGLVAAARELGVNVSQACETGLARQVSDARGKAWQEEHRDTIESWNVWVDTHGLPLEKYRQF